MKNQSIRLTFMSGVIVTVLVVFACIQAMAQEPQEQRHVTATTASVNKVETEMPAAKAAPVYADFLGIKLGMTADQVRSKLENLRDKGDRQDLYVFSETKLAQVFYNDEGKVVAVSIDYLGGSKDAPTAESVLGQSIEPRADGSLHKLKRFHEEGYWIAYSRTAGDSPITTVTMQKIQKVE